MIKTKLVLGSLEAVFNGPTTAFNLDQCLNRSFCGAPCGEVGQITIGDVAPDQETARPQAMVGPVELLSIEIGQFAIDPIVQPRTFGSFPR